MMEKLTCYFIGHIPQASVSVALAKPIRHQNMAFSFTESLAQFFYEFAEKHFHFEQGDEILLINCTVGREEFNQDDFFHTIDKRLEDLLQQEGGIVKSKRAVPPHCKTLTERVHRDLLKTHSEIIEDRCG